MAEEYQVSRTTLRRALQALEGRGWISPPDSTRGRRPAAVGGSASSGVRPAGGASTVLTLTPSLRGAPALLEQLADLRGKLGRSGLHVQLHETGVMAERKNPLASLRRLAEAWPGAVWVLNRMPRPVQRAVEREGWPAVVFGSVFDGVGLPFVDVDFRAAGRHAAGLCLSRGCRRIIVVVSRTTLAGDLETTAAVRETLARAGAPEPLVWRHDFNRARLTDRVDSELVGRPRSRDAVIVANLHHFLTLFTHLMYRGIRIPQDLGIICLSNDPVLERISPLPHRYDSGGRLTRYLADAVRSAVAGELPESRIVMPRLLEGRTLPVSRRGR